MGDLRPSARDSTIEGLLDGGRFDEAAREARKPSAESVSARSLQRICDALWPSVSDERADAFLLEALDRRPGSSPIQVLERRRFLRGDMGGVEAAIRLGIERFPKDTSFVRDLARLFVTTKRTGEAQTIYRELVSGDANDLDARASLAFLDAHTGHLEASLGILRRLESRAPDLVTPSLVALLLYSSSTTDEELLETHLRRARQLQALVSRPERPRRTARPRRLKIGYVSADFRQHSVASFILPVLRSHDSERFEVHAYHTRAGRDAVTEKIARLDLAFHDVSMLDDDRLAQRIRDDGIDVLVDLGGHTEHSRLGVLTRQPAPVSISYLGYAATTGLEEVDARITDSIADPIGDADDFHTETLVRIPGSAWCFEPAEDAVDPLPASDRPLTFGSFNALFKTTPEVVSTWASILRRVPGSRLVLKARELSNQAIAETYTQLFANEGIGPERVRMLGWKLDTRSHLQAYGDIDIALDPFPYNGTTTTCEALWMGVPVVTLNGNRHAGRVGASLLSAIGQSDLVAATRDDYVAVAVALATNLERRVALRGELRQRMQSSLLCDATGFTRKLEGAYETLFKAHLDGSVRSYTREEVVRLGGLARRAADAGFVEVAAHAAKRALTENPGHRDLVMIRARSLEAVGDVAGAAEALEAAELDDANGYTTPAPLVLGELARLRGRLGDRKAQEATLRKAVGLFPDSADSAVQLGTYLRDAGRTEEARAALEAALRVDPKHPRGTMLLGILEMSWGRAPEGIALLTTSVESSRGDPIALSNLLYAHQFVDGSREEGFRRHLLYGVRHARPQRARRRDRDPGDKLGIGYLSADFREHSVARFIEPILRHHDRERFLITLYASVANPDDVTTRLAGLVDQTIFVDHLDDELLGNRIAEDGVDILIELGGHTAKSRLLAVSSRPAPVQVAYLGYPDTTGVPAMGYRLTDSIADPEGDADAFHSERLIRLPDAAWCFISSNETPPVRERPDRVPLVYGSFNDMTKIGDAVLETWAAILKEVPGSRLLLKSKFARDRVVADRVRAIFGRIGVEMDRVELRYGSMDVATHLDTYAEMDVALDPFPYCGTTTTCEALDMGVPVVSLAGDRHVARVGASLLARVGLSDLVAKTRGEYVDIAVLLGRDPSRLQTLRRSLRATLGSSVLGDAERFTGQFEAALEAIWRAHDDDSSVPRSASSTKMEGIEQKRAAELWKEADTLLRARKLEEAEVLARQAIATDPGSAEAFNVLGNALVSRRDEMSAEEAYRSALAVDPGFHKAYNNLGNLLRARGDIDAAIAYYQRALELNPDAPRTLSALGGALQQVGKYEEARTALTRAHALDPGLVQATVRLSRVLAAVEGAPAAEAFLRDAIRARPNDAVAVGELGSILHGAGRLEEAAPFLERALALGEASPELLTTLADSLRQRHELTRSIALLEKALSLNPNLGDAHLALAFALGELGRHAAMDHHYELARRQGKVSTVAQAVRLYYLLHDERQTPQSLKSAHIQVGNALAKSSRDTFRRSPHKSDRPLRIGYASPDFRAHVVALFMEGVLRNHDRARVEVELISWAPTRDSMTDRFAALATMHAVEDLDDDALVERLRALDLDVLVDLAGHTRRSKLGVFARRVAPVQVSYLGYPSTTGLDAFDWRITDQRTDPEGAEEEFVERLYRLPDLAWSYSPWADSIEPIKSTRTEVVFGCFNRREKISPLILGAWKRILSSLPEARLFLKAKAFADKGVCDDVLDSLGRETRGRVRFEAWRPSPADNYLAYGDIDVALDTYPYNGTTTTCDALWMGAPVVSLHGATSASRVGRSLLEAVGQGDLATSDIDGYVTAALRIANDPDRRRMLRNDLRGHLQRGPLGDGRRLARQLEDAYRVMLDRAEARRT